MDIYTDTDTNTDTIKKILKEYFNKIINFFIKSNTKYNKKIIKFNNIYQKFNNYLEKISNAEIQKNTIDDSYYIKDVSKELLDIFSLINKLTENKSLIYKITGFFARYEI